MDVLLVLPALGAAAIYLGACAFWPFVACRSCSGTGKHPSPSGRAWRSCGRCEATGRRVRLGRRVYERLRDAGT